MEQQAISILCFVWQLLLNQMLCGISFDYAMQVINQIKTYGEVQHKFYNMTRGGKLLKIVEKETCYRIMTNSETNFGDAHTNDDQEQNKQKFLGDCEPTL